MVITCLLKDLLLYYLMWHLDLKCSKHYHIYGNWLQIFLWHICAHGYQNRVNKLFYFGTDCSHKYDLIPYWTAVMTLHCWHGNGIPVSVFNFTVNGLHVVRLNCSIIRGVLNLYVSLYSQVGVRMGVCVRVSKRELLCSIWFVSKVGAWIWDWCQHWVECILGGSYLFLF